MTVHRHRVTVTDFVRALCSITSDQLDTLLASSEFNAYRVVAQGVANLKRLDKETAGFVDDLFKQYVDWIERIDRLLIQNLTVNPTVADSRIEVRWASARREAGQGLVNVIISQVTPPGTTDLLGSLKRIIAVLRGQDAGSRADRAATHREQALHQEREAMIARLSKADERRIEDSRPRLEEDMFT